MKSLLGILILTTALTGCQTEPKKKFRLVDPSHSGIAFRNDIVESVDFNIFNYLYFYNGGGVAVGDVNGDSLMDVYFTANQEPNRLYLNKGNLTFLDATEASGTAGFNGWATGVTMADVNADGRLDIYVSYLGDYRIYKGKNQLFINMGNGPDGVPVFEDKAMEYGLDLVGFSTQAAFFDYDGDGDLDMYMLNHSVHQNGTYAKSKMRRIPHPLAGDRLMRNDNGKFVDVTGQAGIYSSALGYGLGLAISDVNLDGWLDIYVGNDFHENDYLYINQGDGTFKEELEQQMMHTSRYTMGVDFADANNDAFPDLIAMDMLPNDPAMLKASMAEDAYDVYDYKLSFGYNHQYARNVLQINNQDGSFSDIALLSGIAATDWSWSTFLADLDLNGTKDVFVANGIKRRSNDLDYINFISQDSVQMQMQLEMTERELQYIRLMPEVKIPNFVFSNESGALFKDRSMDWGVDQDSYSQGAAYADFDNDGDLDIVVNNLDDIAFLYENTSIDHGSKDSTGVNWIKIELAGEGKNRFGIGTKVFLYTGGDMQMLENMPTRGFQSAVDYRLNFGLGDHQIIDSLIAVWPDGRYHKLTALGTNRIITLNQHEASGAFDYDQLHYGGEKYIAIDTSGVEISYKHEENNFIEFNREQLLPHMLSAEGPASAVADVNKDGKEDLFLGGAKWQSASLFLQGKDGKFVKSNQPAFEEDATTEDVDALFFDCDNDGDEDLLVVSGGNEFYGKSEHTRPRLYRNDGAGNFQKDSEFPVIFLSGSCVAATDFNKDGAVDLFIGARTTPWHYGTRPDSYLLLNAGEGRFRDVTDEMAPELRKFGFVRDALWADLDADGDPDLAIAAEWMPVSIFKNHNGRLERMTDASTGLQNTNGWWTTLEAGDIDNDGDLDLVAGNFGLNSKLKASVAEPVQMYVTDFDKNDSIDFLVTHYLNGEEYAMNTRDEMAKQMPFIKKRYLSYKKFSAASFHEMFASSTIKAADKFAVHTFATSVLINNGAASFSARELPWQAQVSVVNAIAMNDLDGDGNKDLVLAGNFFPVNIQLGRYDASYGQVLKGDGHGNFDAIPAIRSGLQVRGEVRKLQPIQIGLEPYYLAVRNNDKVVPLKVNQKPRLNL